MSKLLNKADKGDKDVRRFKLAMIFYYAVIIIGITVFISWNTIKETDDVLKSKVSELTSALNVQMKMNIDSYLSKVETTATLIFAEKDAYMYDATDESNDEYEALNTEKYISDKLYSLCLMENFVDFSIVYRNDHVVGKLSNNTKDLFGDRLYEDLEAMINRERTHDGWLAGYNGNFNRIYYVKRVNDNAVLVTSFYTSELKNVFEHPGGIEDITIRLIEKDNVMIYSSEEGETGNVIDSDILERIAENDSVTLMDDEYFVTVNPCGDNWKVICSTPTEVILKEGGDIQLYILTIGIIAAIIAIILSVILSFLISRSMNKTVTSLSRKARTDQLTGILNKRSFEVMADSVLKTGDSAAYHALILIDVDDFKGINDHFGHAFGDKVLAAIGEMLRKTFRSDDLLGRIGGDEFCVLMNITAVENDADRLEVIDKKCSELCAAFRENNAGDSNCKVSASIGVSVSPTNGTSFGELYDASDKALYASKANGKDTFTIYN
ncbi:MAG: GGDEF domain-containing protein [Eubacterium sp.]|nr:GGDEF domain-containing protein [Eubacterium sp.]